MTGAGAYDRARADEGAPAVECQAVVRRFGDVTAVDGLTIAIERGSVYGLLGHNGAGKTTTVRLLNGVLAPDGGRLRVLGLDPTTRGNALRERTGVLGEEPGHDPRLTGRENLRYLLAVRGIEGPAARAVIDDALARHGLSGRADDRVGTYSRGMRQRLALARALLHRPELVFLDEPNLGLDPVAAAGVRSLVRELASEGCTVVLCTHDLELAQRVCDRVAILRHGRLVAEGPPSALGAGVATVVELDVGREAAPAAIAILGGAPRASEDAPGVVRVEGLVRDDVPRAVAALVAGGLPVYRVAPREPDLEDAYRALAEGDPSP